MAYRLGEYVVYAELWNTSHYGTHGWLALRSEKEDDEDAQIRLELTGNCDDDLRGKHIRFWPKEQPFDAPMWRGEENKGFQRWQVGPTGTMTAEGWARVLPCPVEEFMRRAELGEPPHTEWKRRLYLEWFGQNGRVVVEMADPAIEVCVREGKNDDEGDWEPLPNLAPHPGTLEQQPPAGLEITVLRREDDVTHTETWAAAATKSDEPDASLQRHLDSEADAVERAIRGEPEEADDSAMREMELIDYCIDHEEEEPLANLIEGTADLRPPEDLNDEEVEAELKSLLARLALVGVALNVCEHYTPRDCYRLMRDRVLKEAGTYKPLIGTGWVTHVCTYEYCDACEQEWEAEYEERHGGDRQRPPTNGEPADDTPVDEDDIPF